MRQDMTMDEVMEYQGRLYFMPRKKTGKRQKNCWILWSDRIPAEGQCRKLSGGMKRKLMVAGLC